MRRKILIWSLYFALWQGIAMVVNQAVILPSFTDVFVRLIQHLSQSTLYINLFYTLFRVIIGTVIAFVLSLSFALLSYDFKWIKQALNPLILISKTIPNITYILLVLIWFSRELSVLFVTILILFPVLYNQISISLMEINPELLELLKLYPETYYYRLIKVILPLIKISLFEGIKGALSLGFKVGVMAEILGQVQPGLGYLMHIARMNFETVDLFAYTAIMIIVVILIEKTMDHFKTLSKVKEILK
ncbi:MAG TPA: ABC transporter permease subunit [Erysipelotrichaceae bacterium]|nr:ABC transporter permease subunit [Erysipelotrichaceae bacterium]